VAGVTLLVVVAFVFLALWCRFLVDFDVLFFAGLAVSVWACPFDGVAGALWAAANIGRLKAAASSVIPSFLI
jgi:hypothetical protein